MKTLCRSSLALLLPWMLWACEDQVRGEDLAGHEASEQLDDDAEAQELDPIDLLPDEQPALCVDCACHCADGRFLPYGGCFTGPIPDEVLNCSRDCKAECGESCVEPSCSSSCPGPRWQDDAGCSTCACAPPDLAFVTHEAHAAAYLNLEVEASNYIGGINRWVFAFRWLYDDPASDDEEQTFSTTLRIQDLGSFALSAEHATLFFPDDSLLELNEGLYEGAPPSGIRTTMQAESGFLSIRLVDGVYQGGLSLRFVSSEGPPAQLEVAGSFEVPVP